ncbi:MULTISPECIES: organic hydroperoxide resistance protein [Carnobacterium]|mgnify:FL=1|jgi:Ohr subfamily peroxiredoxin|uniref:Organic hydroperoxide resistance protein 2 n=2 Tax=Carnobacterium inhibens TaxID=147709 RepID=U5S6W1_9LACT|nr:MULTISPECIES: organic hydroperoxide resistance protein [Carnobacterium]AGY80949.1 Organic hydroperoxide resistance protein 2 [Carnobacterium inhibens subsp. gilichinskyi]MBC9826061.1 Ohr family peroxiredoxin [Carnobacterium inhibens]MDN5372635.1 lipoyl-dependent peroxiredoxin [Carnobacterium sp.]
MADSKLMYQTTAINTGGRNGESHLPDNSFSVRVSTPKDMGGPGQGSNPEQLFALGYSACFNSALEHMMKEEKVTGKSQVTATVELHSDPTDNGFKLAVKLEVGIEGQDDATTQELAEKAHAFCPYSKATSGNIDVTVTTVAYEADK